MSCKNNALRQRVHQHERLIGLWCSLCSANTVEVLSTLPYDWFLLDMEHAPNELSDVIAQLRVLDASAVPGVVRPPSNDRILIKRLLDAGTKNFLFPNVQSAEEAREIVRSTRYAPEGVRGVSTAGRAALYGANKNYLKEAADEICIAMQIETTAALEALPEILLVPEVDVLFFGPADLSADMNLLGQAEHPEVQAQIIRGIKLIRSHNKMAGVLAPNPRMAEIYAEAGAQFIGVGSDIACLYGKAATVLEQANNMR